MENWKICCHFKQKLRKHGSWVRNLIRVFSYKNSISSVPTLQCKFTNRKLFWHPKFSPKIPKIRNVFLWHCYHALWKISDSITLLPPYKLPYFVDIHYANLTVVLVEQKDKQTGLCLSRLEFKSIFSFSKNHHVTASQSTTFYYKHFHHRSYTINCYTFGSCNSTIIFSYKIC